MARPAPPPGPVGAAGGRRARAQEASASEVVQTLRPYVAA
jgi:hypothetical protein